MNKEGWIFSGAWLLALLVLVACGEKEIGGEKDGVERAIGFVPLTLPEDPFRNMGELSDATLDAMAVFAHYTGEADFGAASMPNFMYNQLVAKGTDEVWTYSPVKYWPVRNQKVSFFAVAPAPSDANGVVCIKGKEDAGYPAFTVTPVASPAEHIDFCAATPVLNATYAATNGEVSLHFTHAMAKLKFSAKYNSTKTFGIRLRKIEVKGIYGNGTLSFHATGFGWEAGAASSPTDYVLSVDEHTLVDAPLTQDFASVSTDAGTLLLIPQTLPAEAKIKVTLGVGEEEITREASMAMTLVEGESYNYSLTINDNGLSAVLDNEVWEYDYMGDVQHFVAPEDGTCKLETWGASGGNNNSYSGRGGYSWGERTLTCGELLYVYVGQCSPAGTTVMAWSGGAVEGRVKSVGIVPPVLHTSARTYARDILSCPFSLGDVFGVFFGRYPKKALPLTQNARARVIHYAVRYCYNAVAFY
jgi:hypothetical protein